MLKFVLTAIFIGVLVCLLYQPLSIPDDDSLIDKYRPSLKLQSTLNNAEQSSENNLEITVPDFQIDTINLKGSSILVDSTP
jgi:hypothetical protein